MISVVIQQYKNGPFVIDATSIITPPKIGTNKWGFSTLEFSFIRNLKKVEILFKDQKFYHIRVGTDKKTLWEGRIEEAQLNTDTIDIIAYGYIRAFSDLNVTDLWSETFDPSKWVQVPQDGRTAVKTDSYTIHTDDNGTHIALNKDSDITGSHFAMVYYPLLPGSSRAISAFDMLVSGINVDSVSVSVGVQRINPITYQAMNPTATPYSRTFTTTFAPQTVIADVVPVSGLGFFFNMNSTFLYVGETGDLYTAFSKFRVGSTISISGSRLYADEVLKYYASGISTVNPTQISSITNEIESPLYDLKNVVYENVDGMYVLEDLLSRPTSNGIPFELRIWEDQKVIFREKTFNNTWFIRYSEVEFNRTNGAKYNRVRAKYNGPRTDTYVVTDYVTDGKPPYRSITIDVDTENVSEALSEVNAYLNESAQKFQATIQINKVRSRSLGIVPSYHVRSGDRIIITDIPAQLYDSVNDTFYVGETMYDFSTGYNDIVPEDLNTSLERVIAGK